MTEGKCCVDQFWWLLFFARWIKITECTYRAHFHNACSNGVPYRFSTAPHGSLMRSECHPFRAWLGREWPANEIAGLYDEGIPACIAFSCNCCLVGYKTELSLERYWRGQRYRIWVRRGDCFIMIYTGDIYGTCLDSLLHVVRLRPLHLAGKELPVVSVIFRRSRAVWIFQCSLLWLK